MKKIHSKKVVKKATKKTASKKATKKTVNKASKKVLALPTEPIMENTVENAE